MESQLVTLGDGPLLGVVFPLVIALLLCRHWLFVIACSCILANGAYLATAWMAGDTLLD